MLFKLNKIEIHLMLIGYSLLGFSDWSVDIIAGIPKTQHDNHSAVTHCVGVKFSSLSPTGNNLFSELQAKFGQIEMNEFSSISPKGTFSEEFKQLKISNSKHKNKKY
ncbi:hypothetical protein T11_5093 [Trichinella zimbabwensis]|uniref:Uncharacterized protein n=1 Tax=Trichinella zimbabwensis TaxID=268475 RepID=A0A0V1I3Y3_9BILA|nr:hypothetical protein T11_5093 [Trichinella zimbabwensis]